MRKSVVAMFFCATLGAGAAWGASGFKNDIEKNSYALGVNMIIQLKALHADFDAATVVRGVKDQAGGKGLLKDAEIDTAMKKVGEESQQKGREAAAKVAAENKKRGEAFLAENAKKEGVKVLPGTVQYRVIKAGDGKSPGEASTVQVNYRGTLVDGKEFDASQPGQPAQFSLAQVIPGWREALTQMTVGSKWEVVIPAEKGYGERGAGPAIGPNEALIFMVELVGIE